MRLHRPRPRKRGNTEFETTIEIEGVEMEVMVVYSYQPPEPDVNVAGGIEIEGVYFEDDGCQMGAMTEEQIDALAIEIDEYNVSAWEAAQEDRGCDY